MNDLDRALFEAWNRIWPRLREDGEELTARLARRRGAEMGRPPRAWCLAVRASDTRIGHLVVSRRYRGREVEREEVSFSAGDLRKLCAPLEIKWPGEVWTDVAAKLGMHPETLRHAMKHGEFAVRHVKGLRGRRVNVPLLYSERMFDPGARLGRTPDALWGMVWRGNADRLAEDFEQTIVREPEDREIGGELLNRGWRWICPGCKRKVATIFLPMRAMNLPEFLSVKPERDEVDEVAEMPRVFGCVKCHRVRYFSRVDRHAWNSLVAQMSGGLLYGREVKCPEALGEAGRKRAYRKSARRVPSARRKQVMVLLKTDMTVNAIAMELGVGRETVVNHMRVIYREYDVHSREELKKKLGKARMTRVDRRPAALREQRPRARRAKMDVARAGWKPGGRVGRSIGVLVERISKRRGRADALVGWIGRSRSVGQRKEADGGVGSTHTTAR